MGKERKKMAKQLDELLGLISKEDKPKALKLLWEILYPHSRYFPVELLVALGIIEEEMKKANIPIYLPA